MMHYIRESFNALMRLLHVGTLGYGSVTGTQVIWRRPLEDVERLSDATKRKYTQVYVSEHEPPFILKKEQGSFFLIKKFDNTFGWIDKKYVIMTTRSVYQSFFKKNKWAKKSGTCSCVCTDDALDIFHKKYSTASYVWGGISVQGIDCSGLVQRFFLECCHLIVPKHSKDQMAYGVDVTADSWRNYDVIFLRHKKKRISHVGIWYKNAILHACLDGNGLRRETISSIEERYGITMARRIITS